LLLPQPVATTTAAQRATAAEAHLMPRLSAAAPPA
jgi:hypothetical protein